MASLTSLLQAPLHISSLCLRPSVKGKKEYCSSSAQVSYRVTTTDFHRAEVRSPLVVSSLSRTVEPLLKSAGLRTVRQAASASASATASKEVQELELQEEVQSVEPRRSQSSDETSSLPTVVTFTIPDGSFGADFLADYESVSANWSHLATTTDFGEFEEFVIAAHALVRRWLAPELVAELERYAYDASAPPVLVIRGFPVDTRIPATGKGCWLQKPPSFLSETLLVGISRIIGQPFSVDVTEQNPPYQIPFGMALLVRNIFTTPEHADGVGVGGSKEFLDFHVDFFRFPSQFFPQIFAFMGIRGDPAKVGRTLFVDFRELYSKLDPAERRILREEKVTWDIEPKPFSGYVIEGPQNRPYFNLFVETLAGPDGFDKMVKASPECKAAYRRVKQLAMELSCPEGVWLDAGDVCILHQRKVAHARSCYEPKFEGNDRWMQRVAITTRNIWDDGSPIRFPVRRIPLLR